VFNIGPDKLILLFVIALIVLGPDKLPQAARTMGRVLAEFRRISGSLQSEVREALSDPKDALTAAVADVREELGGVRRDLGGLGWGGDILAGGGLSGGVGTTPSPPRPDPPASATSVPVPPCPDDPSLN
jgi:Tat protein translocase TatB subunit